MPACRVGPVPGSGRALWHLKKGIVSIFSKKKLPCAFYPEYEINEKALSSRAFKRQENSSSRSFCKYNNTKHDPRINFAA